MEKCLHLTITGDKQTIEYIQQQLKSFIRQNCDSSSVVLDDQGYYDEVGGHHDSGMGWAPDGRWCGECTRVTCADCRIWESIKLIRKNAK